jgi:hypothetical protein
MPIRIRFSADRKPPVLRKLPADFASLLPDLFPIRRKCINLPPLRKD